jgi:hypothetical protein
MPKFNDLQVVAAFNSCLNMEAWNDLPMHVKNRFKELLRKNRLKMVCFSDELGLGLRVYADPVNAFEFSGDEAELTAGDFTAAFDLDGHWVRCPKSLWEEAKQPKWLVLNETGTRFYADSDDSDPDEDEDDENEDTEHKSEPRAYWTYRSGARRFDTREQADAKAKELGAGCVVVRDDPAK